MNKKLSIVDMQMHSHYSDGDFSPKELMKMAKRKKLAGAVLTDHTVITGVSEAVKEAGKLGLLTCEGVEINTVYKGTGVHLLGYARRFKRRVLKEGLKGTIEGDVEYNRNIADKLRENGIVDIDFNAILREKKGIVFKSDILRELVRKTKLDSNTALELTQKGGIAQVKYSSKIIDTFSAFMLINRAGGKVVFAHPAEFFSRSKDTYTIAKKNLYELITELARMGMLGIESESGRHTTAQKKEYSLLANKLKLFITAGSDFHGSLHPHLNMGSVGISKENFLLFLKLL